MTQYLVFTLSASIGAMGDLAGHERRGSLLWPGRSAITGLIGAALGLRREDDFTVLDAFGMAVAPFQHRTDSGFRDYHTVETVPSAKAKSPNSRPEALRIAGRDTNTTITLRDYQTGPLFGVVIWGEGLETLQSALKSPVFTLYFGRKSCPLSAPVDARIIQAETIEDAMTQVRVPEWRQGVTATQLITDAEDGDTHIEARHDQAIDRKHWHFGLRQVAFRQVHIEPEVAR
ncbi:type I-E CRISPR-associated protein Cas5/CasD [Thalassospira sp.]|uniref:type I-E CRISPR-associated protein Cas5/CasD n=1 Tax=Thalassospira sp. TaxID=1912094 RepID=UPI002736AB44|nr:type I-E CRISPR-associated protein Cas5/CasD [Thalassospira sp.]MDP2699918.1 type I-E CRISPR-associated protein Cas5/CasD [Thalassospira sp.]